MAGMQQLLQNRPTQGATQSGQSSTFGFTTRPMQDPGSQSPPLSSFGSHHAQASMPDMTQFEPFREAVFQQFERDTQPQIDQMRARGEQSLINKGLTPGSEAYEREMDRMMRTENDAFDTARRSALASALQAQGQFFNQGLGQAQVNAGLKAAAMQNDASRYGSFMGSQASMYGADQGRDGALERHIMSLGEDGRQFDAGLERLLGNDDWSRLMDLAGYNIDSTNANNFGFNNDRNYAANTVGGLLPSSPIIPINAGGAYNTQLAAQQARQNIAAGNHNSLMQGIGSLGSAAMFAFGGSDRNIKEDIKEVDNDEMLEKVRKIPVSRWKYIGDTREHIGPMAQDFGEHLTDEPDAKIYYFMDAIGALMSSVQSLADRVDALNERMEAASV